MFKGSDYAALNKIIELSLPLDGFIAQCLLGEGGKRLSQPVQTMIRIRSCFGAGHGETDSLT